MAQSYTYSSGGKTYTATPNATATPQQISSGANYLKSIGGTPIATQSQQINNAIGGTTTVQQTGTNPADAYTPKPSNDLLDYRDAQGVQHTYPVDPVTGKQIISGQANNQQNPETPAPQTPQTNQTNQQTGMVPYDQAVKNLQSGGLKGTDLANATTSLKDAYMKAGKLASQSGIPAPQGAGAGFSGAQQFLQNTQGQTEPPSILGGVVDTDSNFDSIFTEFDKYMAPVQQKTSLVEEYQNLSKSLGIEDINTELLNSKRIIEGTEDDIRSEITATGGMGTESQVLALANARNKSLIKNYNYLLEARDNAQTQLGTLMNLTIEDRKAAEAEFDRKMDFGFKVAEFKQRATDNARQTYMSLGDKMGWDTLLSSVSPYEKTIIGKTIGLDSNGLNNLAFRSQQDRSLALQKEQLDVDVKRSALATNAMQRKNIQSEIDKRANDMKPLATTPIMMEKQAGNIQDISKLAQDRYLTTAVGPNAFSRISFSNAFTGGKSNFVAGIEQLRSRLNLDSLINAKSQGATFGALSDQELQVLSNTATKMGTWAVKDKNGQITGYKASESDFKKELDKINNYAKLDFLLKGGDPSVVNVQKMDDGTYWTQNSDGSLTQLR